VAEDVVAVEDDKERKEEEMDGKRGGFFGQEKSIRFFCTFVVLI
jgi:hypothetical protein